MSKPFTFDLEKPPTLVKDSDYAAMPNDGPYRPFMREHYRWHCEINRWRLACTFPVGYWDDEPEPPEEEDDSDWVPCEVVGQTSVIKQWTGGKK